MRSDTIKIGGEPYPVKGLSVSQSLVTDLDVYDANQTKDRDGQAAIRLKRMALSLQNGDAYLPDPANPRGQKAAKGMKVEEITAWLDSDVFSDMDEFYKAERITMALADPVKAAAPAQGAIETPGEPVATE